MTIASSSLVLTALSRGLQGPPRTPEAPFPGMSDLSMELVYNPELELDPRMRARSLQQPRTLSG